VPFNENDAYGAAARQAAIQQAAAAAAVEANSPEALAAEAARQEAKLAAEAAEWRAAERAACDARGESYPPEILEPSAPQPVDEYNGPTGLDEDGTVPRLGRTIKGVAYPEDLPEDPAPARSRLAAAVQAVLEDPEEEPDYEPEPEDVMGGAELVQWVLIPDPDGTDGWALVLSIQRHTEQEPDVVPIDVTQAMMRKWRNAPGNANDLERFAAGLMEKVADALAEDLTDGVIEALQRITTGELREKQHLDAPTETSVGEDEPIPFGSLQEYIEMRDHYANTLTRDEYVAFLDQNQDYEDEIERQSEADRG